ncbi:MAG TPA: tRNA (adenosine(37)-N6)-threonylcarbamoyltransferase complex ATPase subunit type 1 TsaE [Candidatus Azoamicus sp.]
MYTIIVKNKTSFINYGKILSKLVYKHSLFFFLGNIGIGKTTLIKSLAGAIIQYKTDIKSPSYKIIEKYSNNNNNICHIDFFKIKNLKNLNDISFYSYLKNNSCFFIEWGDKLKIKKFIPDIRTHIFYYSNNCNRLIILTSNFLNFKKILG